MLSAYLHGEGADDHLSTAETECLVGLSALRSTGRCQRVLTCKACHMKQTEHFRPAQVHRATRRQRINADLGLGIAGGCCKPCTACHNPINTLLIASRGRRLTSHTISKDELGDGEHDGPALDGGASGAGEEDASNEHEDRGQHGAPLAANLVCDVSHQQHTNDDTTDL